MLGIFKSVLRILEEEGEGGGTGLLLLHGFLPETRHWPLADPTGKGDTAERSDKVERRIAF